MIAPPPIDASRSECDSDSDWDSDDDFGTKKINFRIKPITQVTPNRLSASVDELRATVGTWRSLANINLVKPNSRRGPSVTIPVCPIAIAIQESLHARLTRSLDGINQTSLTQLIGRIKLVVPPHADSMDFSSFEENLELTLVTSIPWDEIRLNGEFVNELVDHLDPTQMFTSTISPPQQTTKRLSVDMKYIQNFVKKQRQKQPNTKYIILPELLNYVIGSQNKHESTISDGNSLSPTSNIVNPLNALAHWLCDLTITKVRVDISSLESTLNHFNLSTNDIRNLKITMHVNGGVVSYQSKPQAKWNALNSELTWSFSSLTELVQQSTLNGVTSCLARFNLNDGPSKPTSVNLQFSIADKTVTGQRVILNSTKSFRLVRQKYEVRTGTFKCDPPCL